jgi:hypothetical protein
MCAGINSFNSSNYFYFVNNCNSYSYIENNIFSKIKGQLLSLINTMNIVISNNQINEMKSDTSTIYVSNNDFSSLSGKLEFSQNTINDCTFFLFNIYTIIYKVTNNWFINIQKSVGSILSLTQFANFYNGENYNFSNLVRGNHFDRISFDLFGNIIDLQIDIATSNLDNTLLESIPNSNYFTNNKGKFIAEYSTNPYYLKFHFQISFF